MLVYGKERKSSMCNAPVTSVSSLGLRNNRISMTVLVSMLVPNQRIIGDVQVM